MNFDSNLNIKGSNYIKLKKHFIGGSVKKKHLHTGRTPKGIPLGIPNELILGIVCACVTKVFKQEWR
jgi:hypothetical protein